MNKLLILGSVVSPCPPEKQGGTERVAYLQGKYLAKRGIELIFVAAKGTKDNFLANLKREGEKIDTIMSNIEFVHIGGGTGLGNQEDALVLDNSKMEGSRKMRLEMVALAQVIELMHRRKLEYDVILNNMRGESIFLPTSASLSKIFINVMHLNLFTQLSEQFRYYKTGVITISNSQRQKYPNLNYIATIYNPVNTKAFEFNGKPKNYALMMGTIGLHKNQADAISAAKKAGIPIILAGKIRDEDYFKNKIEPQINGKDVIYYGELEWRTKLDLYRNAKVFLFPISWQEPFGLVCIEALSCGTPVIAYPHGGPGEIVIDGKNGFLVSDTNQMSKKIKQIENIDRMVCRTDAVKRFDEKSVGEKYYKVLKPYFN